jgi:hypothetical protein
VSGKKECYWKIGDMEAKEAAAHTAIKTMLSQLVKLWPGEWGHTQ